MKHTVTLSRFLILSGLSFPMSTGHSLEICLITRVSGMLGPTTWATRSSIDSAINLFCHSLWGDGRDRKTTTKKSLGNTQLTSETLGPGLPSCQGGHPKRLTAHTWTDSSCLGLRSV